MIFYSSFTLVKIFHRTLFSTKLLKYNYKTWNIVFFGSDNYSLPSLNNLYENIKRNKGSLEIVTINDNNPVHEFAVSKHLKTHLWPPVLNGSYDIGVIVSFGKFIPESLLRLFPLGIINVHASLLPQYRGGMPIVHTLKNGETKTGVTIIRINCDKFDTGEIILQKSLLIGEHEMMPSLHKRLSNLGSECLLEVINGLPDSLKKAVPQSNEKASYAPKLTKESSIIKWDEMSATEIYNLYRALFGKFNIKTTWKGTSLTLTCLSVNNCNENIDRKESLQPGQMYYSAKNQCIVVQCKSDSVCVCTFQFKGKLFSAINFYHGYLISIPKSSWILGI